VSARGIDGSETAMKDSYIGQAWLVIFLGLVFGGMLAGVQASLSGRIEQNKADDILSQLPRLVQGADKTRSGQARTIEVGQGPGKRSYRVYRAEAPDGKLLGWVVRAGGQGFADVIELLIGLDAAGETITGLYVLDQKETPGLGDRIRSSWGDQFAGKRPPLEVTKAAPARANQIRAITAATISSESVTKLVNQAAKDVQGRLGGSGSQPAGATTGSVKTHATAVATTQEE